MSQLNGAARELLHKTIREAFDPAGLQQLTSFALDFNLYDVVADGAFATVVFDLIDHCEKFGTTENLVDAIVKARPKRPDCLNLQARLESVANTTPMVSAGRGLFQLPARLRDFTGRKDELDQITTQLRGAGGTVGVSSALRGMGGVGKTKTAIEACWLVKDHFPDAQLFVELRGMSEQPMTTVEAMARIIRDLTSETGKLPDTEAELLPVYQRALKDKKVLILLDDAKNEAQVGRLLETDPPVVFVVTSRQTLTFDGVESIRLGVLPSGETLALLRALVPVKQGANAELMTVAELCGFLPLALRVAGDFLRLHDNWTATKYAIALKNEASRLERLKGKTPDRDVEAVLGFSASELVSTNAELASRWQLLSIFPTSFDVRAASAVWDLKSDDEFITSALDALTALLDRSLVQFDADTDRYSLHDLMRSVARDTFEYAADHALHVGSADRIALAERRFVGFYRGSLAEANELYLKGNDNILRGLALFDLEEANIRHGQAWAVRHRASDRFAAECCRDYSGVGVDFIDLRLSARERITWLDEAVAACREIGDRRGEGGALGNLGSAWAALGDVRKAITFYEQHLVIAREIEDRHGEGGALGNLGNAWKNLGDVRKAITFHEQHLVIAREIGDRRGEGGGLGNLGSAWAALGDVRKAITFYEQRLVIAREIGDRRGEGGALGNLGSAWAALGDVRKAITFYEQHLVIAREIEDRHGEGGGAGESGERVEEPRGRSQSHHVLRAAVGHRARDRGPTRGGQLVVQHGPNFAST